MKISVASGKGGTGKTTIAINLALSLQECQLLDCDVEEPNAHIFLKPKIETIEDVLVYNPLIDEEKCTKCGLCAEACEFNSLVALPNTIIFFKELCMSCKACEFVCPEDAISEQRFKVGEISIGKTHDSIEFVNGLLNIGIPRGIPVIQAVKSKIKENMIAILDAPPGNSCPVIETISESDYCILVTEPTPFGLYDLTIAVEVVRSLGTPFGVIINRDGLGGDLSVEEFCKKEDIPILMKIPFDKEIAKAYSEGIALVEIQPEWKKRFQDLYAEIGRSVKNHD